MCISELSSLSSIATLKTQELRRKRVDFFSFEILVCLYLLSELISQKEIISADRETMATCQDVPDLNIEVVGNTIQSSV